MLEYGSLSVFYGGLEAIVGSPNPKVEESMDNEHKEQSDSGREFTTGNYGVCTTSAVEWAFVTQQAGSTSSWWCLCARAGLYCGGRGAAVRSGRSRCLQCPGDDAGGAASGRMADRGENSGCIQRRGGRRVRGHP